MEEDDMPIENNNKFCECLHKLFSQTEVILDEQSPIEDENKFQMSDILTPLCLNNIKNDPKYYFQKFKILFVKFFTMQDYFFKMEKNNNQVFTTQIIQNNSTEIQNKKVDKKKKTRNHSVENKNVFQLNMNNYIGKITEPKKRKNSYKTTENISFNSKSTNNENIKNNNVVLKDSYLSMSIESNLSSFNRSETINTNSISYEQKQAIIAMGLKIEQNTKKINIKEIPDYKLKLIKSNLNLEDNDEMGGKAYEEYANKILKIMLIMVLKKEIFFENPSIIIYSKISDFY